MSEKGVCVCVWVYLGFPVGVAAEFPIRAKTCHKNSSQNHFVAFWSRALPFSFCSGVLMFVSSCEGDAIFDAYFIRVPQTKWQRNLDNTGTLSQSHAAMLRYVFAVHVFVDLKSWFAIVLQPSASCKSSLKNSRVTKCSWMKKRNTTFCSVSVRHVVRCWRDQKSQSIVEWNNATHHFVAFRLCCATL